MIALLLQRRLDELGVCAEAKTSGSAGMHVLVPTTAKVTFEDTRAFAVQIASELTKARPDLVSDRLERAGRAGRVLVDARQNAMRLTTIVPFSLRAARRPTVSTPVSWDEIRRACERRDVDSLVFTADQVIRRINRC
jgi:bifunctional non-homologous end joining protein LigD